MTYESTRYRLDEPHVVPMTTITGDTIEVTVTAIDTEADRVDLSAELSDEEWARVMRSGAFHVDLEPGFVPDEPGASVEVMLVLRRPVMDRFDDGDAMFAAVFEPGSVVQQTESWLLTSAMRRLAVPGAPDATAASGYRTRWSSGAGD